MKKNGKKKEDLDKKKNSEKMKKEEY